MNFHIHKRLVLFVVTVLSLLLIFLCIFLYYRYSEISPERVINRERFSRLTKDNIKLGSSDVQTIMSWMTFDYINHVFGIPPQYIKSEVNINDSRYPRLTLSRYARDNKIDEGIFTTQIQNTVKNYFLTLPSKQ